LQDWNVNPGQQFPWIWELEERGVDVKYLLGQWGHAWPHSNGVRMDWADDLKSWFDKWLKGERVATGPKVQVQDHTDQWRNAKDWPLGKSLTYYLNAEHQLGDNPGDPASETVATDPFHMQGGYTTDSPIENAACLTGTCTYFETEPLADELRVGGVPRVNLTVTPSGPGGTLSVYLYAASADAMQRIGWGQVDLRFAKSSTEPATVTPGEEIKVSFDMQPLDAVVAAGERLYLVVSSGTGWNRLPGTPMGPIALAEGKASSIEIVGLKTKPGDFFTPANSEE
jgi:putative CocE/NonD family hydrolase